MLLSRRQLLAGTTAMAVGSLFPRSLPKRWQIRCVDTMKTSRDACRAPLDASRKALIRAEIAAIKQLGATHVAVATPYDPEFMPFLRHWVSEVHAQGLKVWFRGNFCGWEGWFDYPVWGTSYDRHIAAAVDFVHGHADLFASGDSFNLCPEPENSALMHDPRAANGHPVEFRGFLRDSVSAMRQAFRDIGKRVEVNWLSVNGDIGRDILDKETVDAMGGLVTIDHYVPNVAKMIEFVDDIHRKFDCKVLIGEFGAPLEHINGEHWSPAQQAAFVEEIFAALWERRDYVVGVSYWVGASESGTDGTRLFDRSGNGYQWRPAAEVVRKYFTQ